jgi:hypothetical protein
MIAAAFLVAPTRAQIGNTICACSPTMFTFTLDFELTCNDANVGGEGIFDTVCTIGANDAGLEVNSPVPEEVFAIDIIELDQNMNVRARKLFQCIVQYSSTPVSLAHTAFSLPYLNCKVLDRNFQFVFLENGATFQYSSFTFDPGQVSATTAPKILAVTLLGTNSFNEDLRQEWTITYTNECGIFPVLTTEQQIGWTRFVSSRSRNGSPVSIHTTSSHVYSLVRLSKTFIVHAARPESGNLSETQSGPGRYSSTSFSPAYSPASYGTAHFLARNGIAYGTSWFANSFTDGCAYNYADCSIACNFPD